MALARSLMIAVEVLLKAINSSLDYGVVLSLFHPRRFPATSFIDTVLIGRCAWSLG